MRIRLLLSVVLLSATTSTALAHPGHGDAANPLAAGLAHPLLGFDHVLAIVAVGLWAALPGGRLPWMLPSAFVVCMVGGFFLATAGIGLPMVEPGIAASVLVLGLVVAAAVRPPVAPSMVPVGLFGVFHGHAHGVEVAGSAVTFGVGFVIATLVLHAAGVGLGQALGTRHLAITRGLGGLMAGTGLVLLGGFS